MPNTTPSDTTPPIHDALREYLSALSQETRAHAWLGELTEIAEASRDSRDFRDARQYRDGNYAEARDKAYRAAQRLLDRMAELKDDVASAISDAWAYRIGEASGEDDPDLEPTDREHAVRYSALADQLGITMSP